MKQRDTEVVKKVVQWLGYADEDLQLARYGLKSSNQTVGKKKRGQGDFSSAYPVTL